MDEFKQKIQAGDWTLFLDRDGVINTRPLNDYVKSVSEFHFLNSATDAVSILSKYFKLIFVVTNQQGIGKGLMTMEELNQIHDFMKNEIFKHGGRIDAIYVAPQLRTEKSTLRKPGVGMGLMAKADFPEINFTKSVMVGDALTDMIFAKRLNMKSVFIGKDEDIQINNSSLIDYRFDSLIKFAKYILH